jgi:hypothetical protein
LSSAVPVQLLAFWTDKLVGVRVVAEPGCDFGIVLLAPWTTSPNRRFDPLIAQKAIHIARSIGLVRHYLDWKTADKPGVMTD